MITGLIQEHCTKNIHYCSIRRECMNCLSFDNYFDVACSFNCYVLWLFYDCNKSKSKFWQIRVPTRDLLSRRILKVCNLGRVEAWYSKPKIVFSRSTNTSPVRTHSNIIVHTQILIRVIPFFPKWEFIRVFIEKFN